MSAQMDTGMDVVLDDVSTANFATLTDRTDHG